jgi:cytochrome P450
MAHPDRSIATPPGHWLLGHQPAYARDPLKAFRRWSADHGEVVRLRFGPIRLLLLTSPAALEDLALHRADDFRKAPVIRRLAAPVIGESLFTVEGEEWRRQRQLLEPSFAAPRMADAVDLMSEASARLAESWRPGQMIDLLSETMRLSQQIVARVLFGSAFSDAEVDRVADALVVTAADFQRRLNSPSMVLPDWVPVPRSGSLRRAVSELDDVVQSTIRMRRAAKSTGDDLLGELLDRQPSTPWMTDRLIRDNVLMLLVQGREDPALLLTWSLYLLARHPEVAERLRVELTETLAGRPPRAADLGRLPLAEGVLREALRLYPPVYSTGRQALRDTTVAGVAVKRGVIVLTSQAVTHRDGRFFEEPDAFRPDRWAGGLAERLPLGAYAPFGLGARRCLGEHLASMIGLVGLSVFGQRWRLARPDPDPIEPAVLLSLRPSRPVLMRVEPAE